MQLLNPTSSPPLCLIMAGGQTLNFRITKTNNSSMRSCCINGSGCSINVAGRARFHNADDNNGDLQCATLIPSNPIPLPPISKYFPSFRLTVHRETEASDKNEEGTALLLQPMIPFLANRCPTFLNARQIWPLFCYQMRNALQMKGANLLRPKAVEWS